jgi:hypothetical protein
MMTFREQAGGGRLTSGPRSGYEAPMWSTDMPDGRFLTLRKTEDGWLATCLSNRSEAPTAEQAIREAAGGRLLDRPEAEFDEWVASLVAELETDG